MASSGGSERLKLTASIKLTSITAVGQSSTNSTTESSNSSTEDPPISRLPPELLSAIINYLPMSQWSNMEFVNRSFRNAVHLSWHSVKEFDVDKDVLTVRQSFKGANLSKFLPSILAKLRLRSPLLTSIIGLPLMGRQEDIQSRSQILHAISQFTHLKRIKFGAFCLGSTELVEFLASSPNRDQLKEISASAYYQRPNRHWQDIFAHQENRVRQASLLQLETFSLMSEPEVPEEYRRYIFLDPGIVDLINPSSLTQLVLVNIAAPSDYLLSLISDCRQLKQLQFSFMSACRCQEEGDCVHLITSKRLLETISAFENLTSLKIGLIENRFQRDAGGAVDQRYLDILDDLPILIDRLGNRGRLAEFGLLDKYYCTVQVITGIGHRLPTLKSLELFTMECRPVILVNMIKKMVNLEKLTFNCDMYWNRGITSEVLNAVATYVQHLKVFRLLWLGQDVIVYLNVLTRLNRLEELFVYNAFFSDVKWEVGASFGQLRSLEMQHCDKDLVVSFLNRAPGLRRLVLGGVGATGLPDEVLRMIPGACQQLRQLDLSNVLDRDVNTKEAVRDIIDRMPDLIQLKCWK